MLGRADMVRSSIGLCLAGCLAAPIWVNAYAQAQAALNCLGEAQAQQTLRDQLQVALSYLHASKDNFGPGRGEAISQTEAAIAELIRLHGDPFPATPGAEVTQQVGRHGHPRMQRALGALREVLASLDASGCRDVPDLAGIRTHVVAAVAGIYRAFSYNPPFSGN